MQNFLFLLETEDAAVDFGFPSQVFIFTFHLKTKKEILAGTAQFHQGHVLFSIFLLLSPLNYISVSLNNTATKLAW